MYIIMYVASPQYTKGEVLGHVKIMYSVGTMLNRSALRQIDKLYTPFVLNIIMSVCLL